MKPTVSIVILNYNGKKYLDDCISSVLKQNFDMKKVEIIFVDNCSTDDSVEFVRKKFPKVKTLQLKENLGFTGANNIAYKKSKGEYLILLNNDTILPRLWLKSLVNSKIKDKDVAIVGAFDFPIGTNLTNIRLDKGETISPVQTSVPAVTKNFETLYGKGYSCIVKKNIFDKLFDDDYFIYNEDIYLGWLAHLKGYKVFSEPKAKIWHYGSGTMKKAPYRSIFLSTRNKLINFLIFYEKINLLKILPLYVVDLIVRFFYFLFTLDFSGIAGTISACLWIISHPLSIIEKRRYVQKQRKVPDSEIIKVMSYKFFGVLRKKWKRLWKIVDSLTFLYYKLFGIKTYEFFNK